MAFLRRRAPERCVVFAAWDVLEPAEGKFDEAAFEELRTRLNKVGETTNTKIHIMHEDIFNSMHKI